NKFKETPGVTKNFKCHISSSTLWFENSANMKTTVSFLNYWKIKNNANVDIEVKTYSMKGSLLKKQYLNFTKGYVKNFLPLNGRNGSGSVEIKIISKNNLRVPYAAIVAIYKTKYGISGVHSYSRTYYNNGEELSDGCEGSWTIRDSNDIDSFCVFHNGSKIQPKQKIQLKIQNRKNQVLIKDIDFPTMKPYATAKIITKNHVNNLIKFLDHGVGTVSCKHKVNGSFARMLIGNKSTKNGVDMQVTHSNFNYKEIGCDDYLDKNDRSLKPYPGKVNNNSKFIIYPHIAKGDYTAKLGKKLYKIDSPQKIIEVPVNKKNSEINFTANKGSLPTRLQLGIISQNNKKRIPNEVAFSAITTIEPMKRFHWGICAFGEEMKTKIIISNLKNLDKNKQVFKELVINIYAANNKRILNKKYDKLSALKKFEDGVDIKNIFSELKNIKKNSFGYYSIFSEYGRFLCYSEVTNKFGSVFKEHSF
ncbi:MAG: hypothetical protein VX089_04135, partial [Pseudomonadota bacterium]|nr:hypothetical protein [Pseudomonadota bacterium]